MHLLHRSHCHHCCCYTSCCCSLTKTKKKEKPTGGTVFSFAFNFKMWRCAMEPSVFFQSLFSTNVILNFLLLSRPQCLYFIVDMTKDRKCRVFEFSSFFPAALRSGKTSYRRTLAANRVFCALLACKDLAITQARRARRASRAKRCFTL